MESLSDDAQSGNFIPDQDLADTKYSMDGAEASMVTLVDGKLTPIGNTHDDVVDDQLLGRATGSDEERGLQDGQGTMYEKSDAALRGLDVIDPALVPDDPIADAEITGNPDAGATVEAGLPSEDQPVTTSTETDSTPKDRVQANGNDLNTTQTFTVNMMIPQVQPDPTYPDPGTYSPNNPFPEIPEIPGTPTAPQPEIQEPIEPGQPQPSGPERIGFVTYTSMVGGFPSPDEDVEPGSVVPGNQYEGMSTGVANADEGMSENPNTGRSARPYDEDAKDDDSYQPGERPNEAVQMESQPREMMDESSVKAGDIISGSDRSDQKSTDGLDRNYNDPEAARDQVI